MKINTKSLIVVLCALVFGAMLLAPAVYAADEQTFTGSVAAVKNAKGKITGVTFKTDEGDFAIATKAGKGKELMKLVNKKIEATGTVKETKGKKVITIKSYKVVEGEAAAPAAQEKKE